jgi:glucan biosynthesis protein
MLLTVEGTYRNGKVELAEIPDDIEQADVIVTFLKTKQNTGKSKMITHGMFAGKVKTNEEDFRLAEWRGEKEIAEIGD